MLFTLIFDFSYSPDILSLYNFSQKYSYSRTSRTEEPNSFDAMIRSILEVTMIRIGEELMNYIKGRASIIKDMSNRLDLLSEQVKKPKIVESSFDFLNLSSLLTPQE